MKAVVDAIFSLDIQVFEVDPLGPRIAAQIFDEFEISPYDCIHVAVMKKASIKEIISDRDFDKINWIRRLDQKTFNLLH